MTADDTERLAGRLLEDARVHEQASHRITPADDIDSVRAEIRRLAREAGIRIRTGIVDGALVVIRSDAALWNEPTSVMKAKLRPRDERSAEAALGRTRVYPHQAAPVLGISGASRPRGY